MRYEESDYAWKKQAFMWMFSNIYIYIYIYIFSPPWSCSWSVFAPSFIANFYRYTTGAVRISNWYLLFGIPNTTLSLSLLFSCTILYKPFSVPEREDCVNLASKYKTLLLSLAVVDKKYIRSVKCKKGDWCVFRCGDPFIAHEESWRD